MNRREVITAFGAVILTTTAISREQPTFVNMNDLLQKLVKDRTGIGGLNKIRTAGVLYEKIYPGDIIRLPDGREFEFIAELAK